MGFAHNPDDRREEGKMVFEGTKGLCNEVEYVFLLPQTPILNSNTIIFLPFLYRKGIKSIFSMQKNIFVHMTRTFFSIQKYKFKTEWQLVFK